jgi:hypothetical protein
LAAADEVKPTSPKPSARNSTKVPKRPAFDSRASWKMMNTMYSMNALTPKVSPNQAICSSV